MKCEAENEYILESHILLAPPTTTTYDATGYDRMILPHQMGYDGGKQPIMFEFITEEE